MARTLFMRQALLLVLIIPMLACGPAISQITPTPTKTPNPVKTLAPLPSVTVTPFVLALPTNTPAPTATLTPEPATDTPTPAPPTETPTPEPLPTDTPVPPPPPPPPPTNTPVPPPPPPTSPPAPAPPPPPASSKPQVVIELPNGNTHGSGDKFKVRFTVRDPDGVWSFTWGVFTQNLTPMTGGEKVCHNAPECSTEEEFVAPPIPGIYIVGADAADANGNTERGIGEIYIQ